MTVDDHGRQAAERSVPVAPFRDPDLPLEAYLDEVLAVCPRCGGCARVVHRRVTCAACGLARETDRRHLTTGHAFDPWFDLPLWLRADVKGEVLWAYNARHLALLRDFVAATHRRDDATRNHMRSVANRLPKWIGLAANRAAILRAITRLESRVPKA
jgi:hypothetical protein